MRVTNHFKDIAKANNLNDSAAEWLQYIWNKRNTHNLFSAKAVYVSKDKEWREIQMGFDNEGRTINISRILSILLNRDYVVDSDSLSIKCGHIAVVMPVMHELYEAIKPKTFKEETVYLEAVNSYALML